MKKSLYENDEILRLIPQRPPMVMIDKFFGEENGVSVSGFTISADNIFVENGVLAESGIVEHAAQSAAARMGFHTLAENEPVRIGFIGSVDKMKINFLPAAGKLLVTHIEVLQQVYDITCISATVFCDGVEVASGKMKIFLQEK